MNRLFKINKNYLCTQTINLILYVFNRTHKAPTSSEQ